MENPQPHQTATSEFIEKIIQKKRAEISLEFHGLQFIPGNSDLVVSFMSAIAGGKAVQEDPMQDGIWGRKFLEKKKYSILGVGRRRSDWYLEKDLHALLESIAEVGFFKKFRRVIFYGGSMGGFAALTFARLAPGCTVLAHNPQTTLHPEKSNWETRFGVARNYDWNNIYGDAADGAKWADRVYVTYDPYCKPDRLHVDRLPSHNLIRLRVPYVGHQMPTWLQKLGILATVFDGAANHSLDSKKFRLLAKKRFILGRYWFLLAQSCHYTPRQNYLLERALSLSPGDHQIRTFQKYLESQNHQSSETQKFKWAFWVENEVQANWLAAALNSVSPANSLRIDPFQNSRHGYLLEKSRPLPGHRAMLTAEASRHLKSGAPFLLIASPKHPEQDLAWATAIAQSGYTAVVWTHSQLDPYQNFHDALAQAKSLRQLRAGLQDMGAYVLKIDSGMKPDDLPSGLPSELDRTLRGLLILLSKSERLTPADQPIVIDWRKNLRPGSSIDAPVFRFHAEISDPAQFHLDPIHPWYSHGDLVPISGLNPPPSNESNKKAQPTLYLQQGDAVQKLPWHQPSPSGPTLFPNQANANISRFGTRYAVADPDREVFIRIDDIATVERTDIAKIKFNPITALHPIKGLYLAPWSIGYMPISGTGSLSHFVALISLLPEVKSQWPILKKKKLAWIEDWISDISGASFKFTIVADPVERFIRLHARLCKKSTNVPHKLSDFIKNFDRLSSENSAIQDTFKAQNGILPSQGLDAIFAAENLAPLQSILQTRWSLSLHPKSSHHRLIALRQRLPFNFLGFRSNTKVPDWIREWLTARYAKDVALHQTALACRQFPLTSDVDQH